MDTGKHIDLNVESFFILSSVVLKGLTDLDDYEVNYSSTTSNFRVERPLIF